MNKCILYLLITLILTSASYANIIVSDPTAGGYFNPKSCQENHQNILDVYSSQLSKQISTLANGYHLEEQQYASTAQLTAYRDLLTYLIAKKILIIELSKQLKTSGLSKSGENIFKLDSIGMNLDMDLRLIISEAHYESKSKNSFVNYGVSEFVEELTEKTGEKFLLSTVKSVASGVAEISLGNALKTTVAAFTLKSLKSAGFATLLSMLTAPLKGSRLPAESIWVDILEKNPELIINPEWMNKAGSPDKPWSTHCLAIQRRTEQLNKILSKSLKAQQKIYLMRILSISEMGNSHEETSGAGKRIEADATRVEKAMSFEARLPYWVLN